jgi:hypothetical protein
LWTHTRATREIAIGLRHHRLRRSSCRVQRTLSRPHITTYSQKSPAQMQQLHNPGANFSLFQWTDTFHGAEEDAEEARPRIWLRVLAHARCHARCRFRRKPSSAILGLLGKNVVVFGKFSVPVRQRRVGTPYPLSVCAAVWTHVSAGEELPAAQARCSAGGSSQAAAMRTMTTTCTACRGLPSRRGAT